MKGSVSAMRDVKVEGRSEIWVYDVRSSARYTSFEVAIHRFLVTAGHVTTKDLTSSLSRITPSRTRGRC